MSGSPLRVGVLGSGAMAETHLRAWRALDLPWVAVHDRNKEASTALGQRFGALIYDDVARLMQDCDVVDICLPTFLHREVVEQAARTGCHVICEKPLALSAEDGKAMIRACERSGVRLFVAMVVRFFPQYLKAADLVHSGHIGSLQVMRLKRVGFPPHGGSSWFADDALSGGVMVDMMLHDIDYALWLAGSVTRVYSKLTRTATRQYAQTILTHDNGVITHIEGGWAYQPGLFRTGLDLAGTQGLVEWSSDELPPTLQLPERRLNAGAVPLPAVSALNDPYTAQLRHALSCLERGTPFNVTAEDALRALQVALAARHSALTGRAVFMKVSA